MFYYKFNRVNSDVRCYAHIYNIIVQAGKYKTLDSSSYTKNLALKLIKAELAKSRSHYYYKMNKAFLPDS